MAEKKYFLEFSGVSCPGCVSSIEQKIDNNHLLSLHQISDAGGSVVCSTDSVDGSFIEATLSSFKGCCDSCEIKLIRKKILSEEDSSNISLNTKNAHSLIKLQYKTALQNALNNKEVACSEHCVCKTIEVDRVAEFQDAPSFASVYNLSELIQEHLVPGLTVIDFGCGTGHDVFRIAPYISPGKIYGIDITPEMIEYAKINSKKMEMDNVQFTMGSDLSSVMDDSCDMIYTNNLFNILEEKTDFIQSCYNKLMLGGKLVIADEFAIEKLPNAIKSDPEYRCGGIASAQDYDRLVREMEGIGFSIKEIQDVRTYEFSYDGMNYPMQTSILIALK